MVDAFVARTGDYVEGPIEAAEYIMWSTNAADRCERAREVMDRCNVNYAELILAIAGLEQLGDEE